MSYQVLARKWRPRRFVETVGQEHVLKALVNALDEDRLHHAYLFTGTRGVGKTSIARLFAKALNCEEGVSSEPCGKCSACTEIAEGRFVDLIEVDAASRTKVEDTRELLENVQYAPTQGRYKVYLIDEVHMLSTSSFNALLKTLEEPPPHIKFLLATTDPQKLPVTILSRCLQFNLKNMAPEKIVSHLQFVLGEEKIPFDDASLWLIARSAEGSMRDALSLTDQAIAFGSGALREDDVRAMLGTIDHRLVFELLESLVAGDGKGIINRIAAMAEFSPDFGGVLAEMISILHRVAVCQVVPEAIDNSLGDQQQVQSLAQRVRAEEIQLYYQIALTGRKDLPMNPNPREALEMTLLRMLAFRPADQRPLDPPPSSADSASTVAQPAVPTPTPAPVETAAPAVSVQPNAEPQPIAEQQQAGNTVANAPNEQSGMQAAMDSAPYDPPPWEEVPPSAYEEDSLKKSEADSEEAESASLESDEDLTPVEVDSAALEAVSSEPEPEEAVDVDAPLLEAVVVESETAVDLFGEETPLATYDLPEVEEAEQPVVSAPIERSVERAVQAQPYQEQVSERLDAVVAESQFSLANFSLDQWVLLVGALGLTGMTESLAKALSLESIRGNELRFHYTAEQEALFNASHQQRISDALNSYFGEPVLVQFELAEQSRETPANYRIRRAEERRIAAVRHLQQDPKVKELIEAFDGELDELSVEPRGSILSAP
jgi:DNA polymerase-3 subunit gamma/tau